MDTFLNKVSDRGCSSNFSNANFNIMETPNEVDFMDSTSTASDLESARNYGNKRRKKSSVWHYFKKSGDKNFAKCVSCGKEYKTSGNTSNLADHLKRFHPISSFSNLPDEEACASRSSSSCTELSSARSSVRSISPFFRRAIAYDSTSKRKSDLDRALTVMIATDMQPFSIVTDSGFRSFVNLLDPRYEIPNKGTIKNNIMRKLYMEAVAKLKVFLKQASTVAITTDCWTSVSTDSYISATCHFVDTNFELKHALLSVEKLSDSHTAQNIANSLTKTFDEWEINDKVVCLVTDNASNMIKAAEILKKRHLPCFAHSLNLVVQENLRLEGIQDILKRCKEIVTHFESSILAADTFRNEQMVSSSDATEPLKLIQEVPTRWNSSYYMIQRILKTVRPLNQALLRLRKAPAPLTMDDITVLKDIEQSLICFEEATRRISGSKLVTISLIIPVTQGIYTYLHDSLPNLITEGGKLFCTGLMDSVRNRLFCYESRSVMRISTILDPRFKKEGFRTADNANQATSILEQEMAYFINGKAGTADSQLNNSSTKQVTSSKSSLFSFIGKRIEEKARSTLSDVIIVKRQYLERKNSNEDTDPLLFWKITGKELEPMADVSKKYLCIPASSVESERIFSSSGNIISERRARLKPKNLNTLLFLNKNAWL